MELSPSSGHDDATATRGEHAPEASIRSLSGNIAIVTGSSRGLGRHIALDLARHGADVALVYLRHSDGAQRVQAEIQALGRRALAIQADVASEPDVERTIARVLEVFSKVDILINNAGIALDGISWKLPTADWRHVLDVNLTGTFLCAKHVLPPMRSRGYGRIVSITSVVGQMGVPGTAAYAASKSAIIGLTKTLAREAAPRGITINALALGYFDEGLLHTLSPDTTDRLRGEIPVGRFGTPTDLTRAVRFLCDRDAGYITGQTININGGYYM